MNTLCDDSRADVEPSPTLELRGPDWATLAEAVLGGTPLDRESGRAILQAPLEKIPSLIAAAYEIRRTFFGNTVQLYYLMNAKSGLCPEDCHYCSQSKLSTAPIDKYVWQSKEQLLAGAQRAADAGACTFCIVASGRGPTEREVDHVIDAVREIKERFSLRICCCLGLLKDGQAERLAAAGVERFNHNLNTGGSFHDSVVTTHTYEDRVATIEKVKGAGISACSGGIVGMGETDDDILDMAFALRDLDVESIPINFLHPIDGTPFAGRWSLTPQHCLKILCLMRFVNPSREIRIAGGRELHLRSLQPLGLYPANSIFVSDYLTTKGQSAADDYRMIEDMGFTIVKALP